MAGSERLYYVHRSQVHSMQRVEVPMALTSSASAAASGIVASILQVAAGVTLDSLKTVLKSCMGKNMGVAYALRAGDVARYYEIVEDDLESDFKVIIDSLKAGIGQGVGATHAALYEALSGAGSLLAVYNAVIHQEAIQPYLARWARSSYRPAIPDAVTAFQMYRRQAISRDAFLTYARFEGWPDGLIPQLESTLYSVPGLAALNDLFWRGKIDDEAWTRAARSLTFDDAMVDALKATREVIPPLSDLINMAVKEAFPVEPGRPQFEAMQSWAARRGLNPWWVERYWLAHFMRMSVERAVDNFVRGYWDEARLRSHLMLMDIHPDDHDAIIRTMYRTPTIYQMRHGFEAEVYTREDLERFMRWRLLSPEDAVKAADATIAYALSAERNSLVTEWLKDFEDGLVAEGVLRMNLSAAKISEVRQDYYVARTKIRRTRNYKRRVLELYEDAYLKDLLTDDELRARISEYIVDPDTADLRFEEAWIKKYRKPKTSSD